MFKSFWPDFFLDECTATDRYLSDVRRELLGNNALAAVSTLYDLGSIDERQARIYVRPTFTRVVDGFRLAPHLLETLPTYVQLQQSRTDEEFAGLLSGMHDIATLLIYLVDWNFWPSGSEEPEQVRAASELVNSLRNALKGEWAQRPPRYDRDRKADVRALELRSLRLQVPDREDVVSVDHVREIVGDVLRLVRRRVENINGVLRTRRGDLVAALSAPDFLEILGAQDVLRQAPHRSFEVQTHEEIRLPKNLLDRHLGPLLIVGAPGSGKTSFCRWNALNDAEQYSAGKDRVIPVYVPLYRLSTGSLSTFENTFLSAVGASALVPQDAIRSWTSGDGRLRLYLDGLDEVVSGSRRKEIIDLVQDGVSRFERIQPIVTARDYDYGPWLHWLPRVALSSLDNEEINQLVREWLGHDRDLISKFATQLHNTPSLESVMRVPFLATLVILVFRRSGQLPESITRLYAMFTDLLCGGWDLAKGVARPSRFGKDTKLMVLTAVAEWSHRNRRKEFTARQLRRVADQMMRGLTDESANALQRELIEDGLLTSSSGLYQFAHLSLQEFFCARSIGGDPSGRKIRHALLRIAERDDWWRQVFRFYVGSVTDPSALAKWLFVEFGKVSTEGIDIVIGYLEEAFPNFDFPSVLGRDSRSPRKS